MKNWLYGKGKENVLSQAGKFSLPRRFCTCCGRGLEVYSSWNHYDKDTGEKVFHFFVVCPSFFCRNFQWGTKVELDENYNEIQDHY